MTGITGRTLGERLRLSRLAKGWSQLEATEVSGVSNANISNYERDFRRPSATTLAKLANAYGVSMEVLKLGQRRPEVQALLFTRRKLALTGRLTVDGSSSNLSDAASEEITLVPLLDCGSREWDIDEATIVARLPFLKSDLISTDARILEANVDVAETGRVEDYFCIIVPDDAMQGDGIREGMIAVVRTRERYRDGQLSMVTMENYVGVRRAYTRDNLTVLAASSNDFAPIVWDNDDDRSPPAKVGGEVVLVHWKVPS